MGSSTPETPEELRAQVRKLRAALEELQERQARAEARCAELQAVIESLGRERAALRSEAGSLLARVEVLTAADARARKLQQEVDDLRSENEFLNGELARVSSGRTTAVSPLPKRPGA